jgi:uroporphyrinogen-III decarboxylase
MMSMPTFMKALKKQPEVAKRALELTTEWSMKFGKAVKEMGPDGMYLCDISGVVPLEYDWIVDYTTDIGKTVQAGNPIPMWHELGMMHGWLEWMPSYWNRGALSKDSFWGWYLDMEVPYEEASAFSREHDIYCCLLVHDKLIVEGGSELEEDIKRKTAVAKLHPKHGFGLPNIDYWTRPEQFDNAMELAKKYGKF